MSGVIVNVIVTAVVLVAGLSIYYILNKAGRTKAKLEAKRAAEQIIDNAKNEAEAMARQSKLDAQEAVIKARSEFEESTKNRQSELRKVEREIMAQKESFNREKMELRNRERELHNLRRDIQNVERRVEKDRKHLDEMQEEVKTQLEKISGMSSEEAKQSLVKLMEDEARADAAKSIKSIEDDAIKKGQMKAHKIISLAVQKSASDYVQESTVSVVNLPNDDMKGRIIGREGRNIRSLEMATGVDLIIDDTPEAILLSSFDPMRREIAKTSIERLIADGRIHPARIEEIVEKVRKELDDKLRELGEGVALELGLNNIHPELLFLVGKLRYRSSYGQNVLAHSTEVARIAGIIAGELGGNVQVARRGGLLHDIGKAVDKDNGGTHVQLGIDVARKYGEKDDTIHCIESHHFDVEPKTLEAVLVQSADTLSAARPGARREILETYIKRLEKLESIADSYQGVNKSYAIQAGREIRIIVESDRVDDDSCNWLARDISKRIESELEYPGEIKVTVIRETRAVDFAR